MSAEYLQQELDAENHFIEQEIAEDEKMPTKEDVGYVAKAERYTYAAGCSHQCTGNYRREGCNCACGEFHGFYEE